MLVRIDDGYFVDDRNFPVVVGIEVIAKPPVDTPSDQFAVVDLKKLEQLVAAEHRAGHFNEIRDPDVGSQFPRQGEAYPPCRIEGGMAYPEIVSGRDFEQAVDTLDGDVNVVIRDKHKIIVRKDFGPDFVDLLQVLEFAAFGSEGHGRVYFELIKNRIVIAIKRGDQIPASFGRAGVPCQDVVVVSSAGKNTPA